MTLGHRFDVVILDFYCNKAVRSAEFMVWYDRNKKLPPQPTLARKVLFFETFLILSAALGSGIVPT